MCLKYSCVKLVCLTVLFILFIFADIAHYARAKKFRLRKFIHYYTNKQKGKVKLETNVKFVVFTDNIKTELYNSLNCNRLVNTVNVMEYTVLHMYIRP